MKSFKIAKYHFYKLFKLSCYQFFNLFYKVCKQVVTGVIFNYFLKNKLNYVLNKFEET